MDRWLRMTGRRHQFRGQFGINETALTTSIQSGEAVVAEEIIRATNDPSTLNDGSYENTPLHLTLRNNHDLRNLRLARLLVQAGADPNIHIVPFGDLDRVSPSPLEELVVYHVLLGAEVEGRGHQVCQKLEMFFHNHEDRLAFLTNTVDLEGIQSQQDHSACQSLVRQTGELITEFLRCGGDPNVTTTFSQKSLFHWVVEVGDLNLARQLLATSRVSLERHDLHGNTALMDAILHTDSQDCLDLYQAMRATPHTLHLNTINCCGETPLFRSAFMGNTELVAQLCRDGAPTTFTANFAQVPLACPTGRSHYEHQCLQAAPVLITPLLAPLLADAPSRLRYTYVPSRELVTPLARPHKHLIDKVVAASVSPLVDLGCLPSLDITRQVVSLVNITAFSWLTCRANSVGDLPHLMFGQMTAGLRQLCVRTIYDRLFPDPGLAGCCGYQYCGRDCAGAVNVLVVRERVEALGLPSAFAFFFEAEAAKYQVCNLVAGLQSLECDGTCSASDDDSFIDDDFDDDDIFSETSNYSSNYADSLLFFSSDMLSEESFSEEVEEEEVEEEEEKKEEESNDVCKVPEESAGEGNVQSTHSCSPGSHNLRAVVETFCEDLAEDLPLTHHNCYQRFKDESTASTTSPCTVPPSPTNLPTDPPSPTNLPTDPPSPTNLPTDRPSPSDASRDPPSLSDPPKDPLSQ